MATPTMMAYLPRMVMSSLDLHLGHNEIACRIPGTNGDKLGVSDAPRNTSLPAGSIAEQTEGPGYLVRALPSCAVVFLDIVGFTPLCEVLSSRGDGPGAELLATGLRLYWEVLQGVVARWGGDVIKYAGDALLAVFCPTSGEKAVDCCRAATQAALDIQASLHEAVFVRGVTFRVRIGVGYGPSSLYILGEGLGQHSLESGTEGGERLQPMVGKGASSQSLGRLEFLLVGPAVSQAITAEKACEAGRVLLSCSAFSAVAPFFACDPVRATPYGVTAHWHAGGTQHSGAQGTADAVGYVVNASLLPLSTLSLEEDSCMPADTAIGECRYEDEKLQSLIMAALPPALVPHLSPTLEPFANELRSVSVVFVHLALDPAWLHHAEGDADGLALLSAKSAVPTAVPVVPRVTSPTGNATTSRRRQVTALPSGSTTARSPVVPVVDDLEDVPRSGMETDSPNPSATALHNDGNSQKGSQAALRGTVLHNLLHAVRAVCNEHQGDLNKAVLDEKGLFLLLVWGLPPVGHEDDAFRATQAALAISRRLQEAHATLMNLHGAGLAAAFLPGPICSLGVSSGTAFCGSIGGTLRREYTVSGDLVNCCARLMAVAKGMGTSSQPCILVDGPTHDGIVHSVGAACIAFDTLAPLSLKGKAKPVQAYVATAHCIVPSASATFAEEELVLPDVPAVMNLRGAPGVDDLVPDAFSRQHQLIALVVIEHMGCARSDRRGKHDGYDCLWLTGEAGIGKTTAIRDVLAWAAKVWRVRFGCSVRLGFGGELSMQPVLGDADLVIAHCSAATSLGTGAVLSCTMDSTASESYAKTASESYAKTASESYAKTHAGSSLAVACAQQLSNLLGELSVQEDFALSLAEGGWQHPKRAAEQVLQLLALFGPSPRSPKVCLVFDEMHLASAADWHFVSALVQLELLQRLSFPAGDIAGRGAALLLVVSRDPSFARDGPALPTPLKEVSNLLDQAQLQLFGLLNVRMQRIGRLDVPGIACVVARMLDTVPGPLPVLRSTAPAALRAKQLLSESMQRRSSLPDGAGGADTRVQATELSCYSPDAPPFISANAVLNLPAAELNVDRHVALLHTVPEALAELLHALSGGHPYYACKSLQALMQVGLVRLDSKDVQIVVPGDDCQTVHEGLSEDLASTATHVNTPLSKWHVYSMSVRCLSSHVKPTDFLPLPYSVQRSISSRVDRLSAHALLTLKTASVLCFGAGQTHTSFTVNDVLRVYPAALPSPGADAAAASQAIEGTTMALQQELREVLGTGLVVTSDELSPISVAPGRGPVLSDVAGLAQIAFDCAVTRDVVYHTMLYTQRRRLHRAAAYVLLQSMLCAVPDALVQSAQHAAQDVAGGPVPAAPRKAKGLSRRRSSAAEQALHARRESGGYQFHYLTLSEEHEPVVEPGPTVKGNIVGVSPGGTSSGPALPTQLLAASRLLVQETVLSHCLAAPAVRESACIAYRHLALAGERTAADLLFEHYVRSTSHRPSRRGTSQPEEDAPISLLREGAVSVPVDAVNTGLSGPSPLPSHAGLLQSTLDPAHEQERQGLVASGLNEPSGRSRRASATGNCRSARGRCSSAPPVPDASLVRQSDGMTAEAQGYDKGPIGSAPKRAGLGALASAMSSKKKARHRAVSAGPSPSGPGSAGRGERTPRTPVFRLHRLPFTSFRLIYRGATAVASGAVAGAASMASAASALGNASVHGAMSLGSAMGSATALGARTIATGVHRGVSLTAQGLTSAASTVTSMAGTALVFSARGMYSLASLPTSMMSRRAGKGRQPSTDHVALDTTAAIGEPGRLRRTTSSGIESDIDHDASHSSGGSVRKNKRRLSVEDKLSIFHHSAFKVNLPGLSTSGSASPRRKGMGADNEFGKLTAFVGVRTGSTEDSGSGASLALPQKQAAPSAGRSAQERAGIRAVSAIDAPGAAAVQFPGRPPRRSRASSCIPVMDVFGCSSESAVAVDTTALGMPPLTALTKVYGREARAVIGPVLDIPAYAPSVPSSGDRHAAALGVGRSTPTASEPAMSERALSDGPTPTWSRLHTLPAAASMAATGDSSSASRAPVHAIPELCAVVVGHGDAASCSGQYRARALDDEGSLRPTLAACDSKSNLVADMGAIRHARSAARPSILADPRPPRPVLQQGVWRKDRGRRNTCSHAVTPADWSGSVQDHAESGSRARAARSASMPKFARVLGQEATGHYLGSAPNNPGSGVAAAVPVVATLPSALHRVADEHVAVAAQPQEGPVAVPHDPFANGHAQVPSVRSHKSRARSQGARHRRCSVAAQQLRAQPIVHTHGLSLQQWVHGLGSSKKDLLNAADSSGMQQQREHCAAALQYDGTNRRASAFDVDRPVAGCGREHLAPAAVPTKQFTPKKHRPKSGQAKVVPLTSVFGTSSSLTGAHGNDLASVSGVDAGSTSPAAAIGVPSAPGEQADRTRAQADTTASTVQAYKERPFSAASGCTAASSQGRGAMSSLEYEDQQQRQHSLLHITRSVLEAGFVGACSHAEGEVVVSTGDEMLPADSVKQDCADSEHVVKSQWDPVPGASAAVPSTELERRAESMIPSGQLPGQLVSPVHSTTSKGHSLGFYARGSGSAMDAERLAQPGARVEERAEPMGGLSLRARLTVGTTSAQRRKQGVTGFAGSRRLSVSAFDMLAGKRDGQVTSGGEGEAVPSGSTKALLHAVTYNEAGAANAITARDSSPPAGGHRGISTDTVLVVSSSGSSARHLSAVCHSPVCPVRTEEQAQPDTAPWTSRDVLRSAAAFAVDVRKPRAVRAVDHSVRSWASFDVFALETAQPACSSHRLLPAHSVIAGAQLTSRGPMVGVVQLILADMGTAAGGSAVARAMLGAAAILQEGYVLANPYHNSTHAADVAQACYALLAQNNRQVAGFYGARLPFLGAGRVLSAVLAALAHDFRHPGVGGASLAALRHPIALSGMYTAPVLENYHAAEAFQALSSAASAGADVLGSLASLHGCPDAELRSNVLRMILVTSLSEHPAWLAGIGEELACTSLTGVSAKLPDELVQQLAVKAADLGNCAKPVTIAREWGMRVMREFHSQGRCELALSLPVSRFMDRRSAIADVAACQSGFARHVALPLFRVVALVWPRVGEGACQRVDRSAAAWDAAGAMLAKL